MSNFSSIFLFLLIAIGSCAFAQGGSDIWVFDVLEKDSTIRIYNPVNITNKKGYDNQPYFSHDGKFVYFSSDRDGSSRDEQKQTDIFRYNVVTKSLLKMSNTPDESEYSPTLIDKLNTFTVVRVEKDFSQHLWRYSSFGFPEKNLFPKLDSIGYHAWITPSLAALFILGSPPSLLIIDTLGNRHVEFSSIGRCLQRAPDMEEVTFMYKQGDSAFICNVNRYGMLKKITPAVPGGEDFCWDSKGRLWTTAAGRVFIYDPAREACWKMLIDLRPVHMKSTSRIRISPDRKKLAIVVAEEEE